MSIPSLVFDSRSIPNSKISEGEKLVTFVTRVLLLHKGVLKKFEISNYLVSSSRDIDIWLVVLERKSIKELILELPKCHRNNRYKMPSTLFSCQMLRCLKLHNVILNLPSQEQGLENLVELYLFQVNFTSETIANLVLNSPLKKLTLIRCDGYSQLKICSPELQSFYFRGPGETIQFLNTSKLEDAYIDLHQIFCEGKPRRDLGASRLEFVLGGLYSVKSLCLSNHFIEIFAACTAPARLNCTYDNLSYLSLVMNLAAPKEVSVILYLLRSSPHLRKMDISSISTRQLSHYSENKLWSASLDPDDIIFPDLRTVELKWFKGMLHEYNFIKSILMNAAMHDKMTITWDRNVEVGNDRAKILDRMMLFERRSPSAKVAFVG